ncbi:Reverse transcriptase domain [Trinorchestia longiramus]|nr:Reverse transcriptase domain [Trinorchestia longiramus]
MYSGLGSTLAALKDSMKEQFKDYVADFNAILATYFDPRHKLTSYENAADDATSRMNLNSITEELACVTKKRFTGVEAASSATPGKNTDTDEAGFSAHEPTGLTGEEDLDLLDFDKFKTEISSTSHSTAEESRKRSPAKTPKKQLSRSKENCSRSPRNLALSPPIPSSVATDRRAGGRRPGFSHSPLHFLLLIPLRSSLPRPHLALKTSWIPLTRLNSDHLPIAISLSTNQPPNNLPAGLSPTSTKQIKKPSPSTLKRSSEMPHYPPLADKGKLSSVTPSKLPPIASSPGAVGKILSRIFPPLLSPSSTNETYFALPIPMTLLSPTSTTTSPRPSQLTPARHGLTKSSPTAYNKTPPNFGPSSNPSLASPTFNPPNQPITFGNRVTTSNPMIAQSFCRQFTIVPHFRRNKSSRKIFRSIHKLHPLDRSFPPFTADQTREAIKKSGTSTAAAIIITIPKPGKPPSLSSSYPPISLLCPAVKVLERLLLPHLTAAIPLSDSQHGFRPLHSTTSALLPLSRTIAVGFNQHRPLRTTIMAIDFSKAFDTVPHPQLISQISSLPLNHRTVRWLVCYLKGRSAKCSYHHHLSSSRPVLAGVPQGSFISPALFNLFVSDYPPTAPLITSYADDFTAVATTTKIPDASAILSAHSADVTTWAQQKGLTVSIAKSQSSVFTPDIHRSRTNPHITWGQTEHTQKETITLTYKALINSIVTYAAPIWFPNASPSSIAKLQTIQNAALRIASGSHKMASASHLHRETGVLPVADHLSLLCSQYLFSSLRPHHPNNLSHPTLRPS